LPHSGEFGARRWRWGGGGKKLMYSLSGYHNQRNELVQALILGKMLNRTV
jgi:hypothetical protein